MLEKRFGKLTVETSREFTYLGMLIKINDEGNYSVNMRKYIEDMTEFHVGKERLNDSKVPAAKDVYEVDEESENLKSNDAKKFHSTTARALYLTNRIRPGAKIATQFCCTRVKEPTENDEKKLMKLLGYLQKTKDKEFLFGRTDIKRKNMLEFF